MDRVMRSRVAVVLALGGLALALVLVVSQQSSSGTPGEQMARFLRDGKSARGRPVLRAPGNAIPILKADEAPAPTARRGATFPLKVLGVELDVPRDVTAVFVSDHSDIFERPYWSLTVRTARHSFSRDIDSRRSSLFRDELGGRRIPALAKLLAKHTELSTAAARERLERVGESLLAVSDEALLRRILRADIETIENAKDWDEAMRLCLLLMARDWVWEVRKPCYTLKKGGQTIYMVYSDQSHRAASIFFLAAFGEDGAMLWQGDVTSEPHPQKAAGVVRFVSEVLGTDEVTSRPTATGPASTTALSDGS